MNQKAINTTSDGEYSFDFVQWDLMRDAAADVGLGADRDHLFQFADDQHLLIIMQPVGDPRGGVYYELGYVTPDQLRDALQVVGLLPARVEDEVRPC